MERHLREGEGRGERKRKGRVRERSRERERGGGGQGRGGRKGGGRELRYQQLIESTRGLLTPITSLAAVSIGALLEKRSSSPVSNWMVLINIGYPAYLYGRKTEQNRISELTPPQLGLYSRSIN